MDQHGMTPRINLERLLGINRIGALPGGGNCRLALSDDDRAGRDLLVRWMRELDLAVTVDAIGNIVGVRQGREDLPPVMFGSHVDTVGTGGRYDGLLGVLAALEACQALADAGIATRRPRRRWSPSPTRRACASSPTPWAAWSMPARSRSTRPARSAASTAPPSARSCAASATPARPSPAGSGRTPI
jgi:hypothetical protein